MTKAAASAAAILTLLTGMALIQAGSLARQPDHIGATVSYSSPRALATARSFYDGIDQLFEFGDRRVERTVSPGFVEHMPDGHGERTASEMVDWLLVTRATWPHLRLEVVDLEQRDQLIAARLKIDPGEPASIPGAPLSASGHRDVLEFLRVEGGAVTDRWDAGVPMPVADVTLQTDISWPGTSLAMPAIEHISLEPGRATQLALDRSLILLGDTGQVLLDQDGNERSGKWISTREALVAEQIRILQGGQNLTLTLRNDDADPGALWVFTSDGKPSEAKARDGAASASISPTILTFIPLQLTSYLRGDSQQVSITRLTLPPGARVPEHDLGIFEEIAVLDGAIEVTVGQGRALKCTSGIARPFDETEIIEAGEGVAAKGSATLGYRATGPQPATILIMRIESPPPPPSTP